MTDRPVVPLGDLVDLLIGPPFKSSVFRAADHGTRLLRGMNVGAGTARWNETFLWPDAHLPPFSKYLLEEGDLCLAMDATFTRSGSIRACAIRQADLPALLVQRVARLRVSDPLLRDFVWLHLTSQSFAAHLSDRQTGAFAPHISGKDITSFRLPLPPPDEQRRIVDLISVLDTEMRLLESEAASLLDLHRNLLLSSLREGRGGEEVEPVRLGSVLKLDIDRVPVSDGQWYRMAGVLNEGKGLIDRGVLAASDTGYATLNRLRAGQLVMRKLTAWEGPIAVVPQAFDGAHASAEFPTFSVDPARLTSGYLAHVCRWPGLWNEMKQRVTGSVQRRKRLNPEQLLDVVVPLPRVEDQRAHAPLLDLADAVRGALNVEASAVRELRRVLLHELLSGDSEIPATYDAIIEGTA